MFKSLLITSMMSSLLFISASSSALELSSTDITHGKFMSKTQEFNGFGCSGKDTSPHLQWTSIPKGTKSFAVTAYDPDAPTGSGWWHWQIVDIPVSVTELKSGAGNANNKNIPKGSTQTSNDYGITGFGGACPPEGHGTHRYQFTVHALAVETLSLPKNASGALVGYMINANSIASSSIESLYKRN